VPPFLFFFSTHAAWTWFMVVQCVFHPCVSHVMARFCYGCLSRSPHSFEIRLVARLVYFVKLILCPYFSFYKIFPHVLVMKLACHLSLHFACNFVSFYEQRAYLQVPVWARRYCSSGSPCLLLDEVAQCIYFYIQAFVAVWILIPSVSVRFNPRVCNFCVIAPVVL
jgi:hypothetical protein